MTARKSALRLASRTPAYVDRETGAAELSISPETWDSWVDRQILPAAAPGIPASTPRWRWADVDRRLSGHATGDADRFISLAGGLHGAPKGNRKTRGRNRAVA